MRAESEAHFWKTAAYQPYISGQAVHVWRIPLDLSVERINWLRESLSVDEIKRADRFRFDVHRHRFIAARGAMRHILAGYLHREPEKLTFRYSPFGKPDLEQPPGPEELAFNISHSQDLALLAVAQHRPVGVDIEFMRQDLADEQIARRFFSTSEVESFLSLTETLHTEAFFNCWTRKEAYIKAIGEGLSMPLDRFDVSLIPGEPAELLATRPDPAQALQWKLYALSPGEGYKAALVIQGGADQVLGWNWECPA